MAVEGEILQLKHALFLLAGGFGTGPLFSEAVHADEVLTELGGGTAGGGRRGC